MATLKREADCTTEAHVDEWLLLDAERKYVGFQLGLNGHRRQRGRALQGEATASADRSRTQGATRRPGFVGHRICSGIWGRWAGWLG